MGWRRPDYRVGAIGEKLTPRGKSMTRPPTGSESGWIADFEQEGAPRAQFGAGWMVTTDAMAAIAWTAGPKTGRFQLDLDNIRLQ